MIHSFTVTLGAKYLTGRVTSVPSYETFSLIKNNILHQSKDVSLISLKTTKITWTIHHSEGYLQFHKYAVHIKFCRQALQQMPV
jgi:predicted ABC-type sugar transport system permease subunit